MSYESVLAMAAAKFTCFIVGLRLDRINQQPASARNTVHFRLVPVPAAPSAVDFENCTIAVLVTSRQAARGSFRRDPALDRFKDRYLERPFPKFSRGPAGLHQTSPQLKSAPAIFWAANDGSGAADCGTGAERNHHKRRLVHPVRWRICERFCRRPRSGRQILHQVRSGQKARPQLCRDGGDQMS